MFLSFGQQDSSADFRRPGRPKGSRDKVPRKTNTKHDAAIRYKDSSLNQGGSTDLKQCGDDMVHVFEEKKNAEQTANTIVNQHCTRSAPFLTGSVQSDSLQSDPFHADWAYW